MKTRYYFCVICGKRVCYSFIKVKLEGIQLRKVILSLFFLIFIVFTSANVTLAGADNDIQLTYRPWGYDSYSRVH